MRLPKEIYINNRLWQVKRGTKTAGCSFKYKSMELTIGVKGNCEREVLNGFMHEVAEISCIERGVRHTMDRSIGNDEGNADLMFIANHDRFTDVITDTSAVIGKWMGLK